MSIRKREGYQHWNTPPEVLDPIRAFEPIELDPCSNANSMVRASLGACDGSEGSSGLEWSWHEAHHTYVNPPYVSQGDWLWKAYVESSFYDAPHITVLIPAATETKAFQELVFGTANAICFWRKRIVFWRDGAPYKSGNTLPSALCYWGVEPERFAEHFRAHGTCVTKWTR